MMDILDRLRLKIQRIPAGSYHTCGDACTNTDCLLVGARQKIEELEARMAAAEAMAAADGTLHNAIDHWQERAKAAEAQLARELDGIAALEAVIVERGKRLAEVESEAMHWLSRLGEEVSAKQAAQTQLAKAERIVQDDDQWEDCGARMALRHVLGLADSAPAADCVWTQNLDGNWETACGQQWCLLDGAPKDNDMTYCHHCGKRIKEQLYLDPDDDGIEADKSTG